MSAATEELLTPRLRLRRWRPEDERPMAAINSDPAVTEFLNAPIDAAATAAFLQRTRTHWTSRASAIGRSRCARASSPAA